MQYIITIQSNPYISRDGLFDVVAPYYHDKRKINAIKDIRERYNIGLKAAKDLVEYVFGYWDWQRDTNIRFQELVTQAEESQANNIINRIKDMSGVSKVQSYNPDNQS